MQEFVLYFVKESCQTFSVLQKFRNPTSGTVLVWNEGQA